jgi:hypothetical protein
MKTTNKGKYYLESLQRKLVPTTEHDNLKYTGHVIYENPLGTLDGAKSRCSSP